MTCLGEAGFKPNPALWEGGGDIGIFSGKTQRGVCLFTSLTQFLFNKILPVYRKKL